jgi:hypothetical protein
MAIGAAEAKFIADLKAHCAAGAKIAENYLKASDSSDRPASVVSRAANMISSQAYEIEELGRLEKYLEEGPNASKEAAARLMGGYDY